MKKLLAVITVVVVAFAFMPAMTFSGSAYGAESKIAAPTQLKAITQDKSSIKLSWSKVDGATGYAVYKETDSKFKKIATVKNPVYTDKKLKKDKIYSYKVKALKNSAASNFSYVVKAKTTLYKESSKVRNVYSMTINKVGAVVKKGEKVTLKVKLNPAKKLVSNSLVWTSSDKSVATVSKGVVTAKAAGTCTITARAHNGRTVNCKVTVISDMSMSKDVYNMTKELAASEDYAFEVGYKLAYDEALGDDTTGFRTAGSDAEHRAAIWLEKEFKKIGLTSVERVPVTVDKWQFNEAWVQLYYTNENGKKKTLRIDDMISYASDGTVQLGGDWSGMEIVDAGMGFIDDYDALAAKGISVKDKIVLVGVDQWNEVWIDGPYMEAANQGAAAIITYPVGGYGQKNEDANNVQDLCAPNKHIPCTSICKNDAERIQAVLDKDNLSATLYVDNYVGDEDGISYNVVGKIAGKDPNAQQIVIAAHYDKYFYGFQDDCIAIGLVMGIAKAMVDSGYQPQNDIVFVAHGAEEWAEFSTSTDWAIGSWEMITEAKADWQGRTLALINYELPAIDHGATNGIMRTSYEMGVLGHKLLDSDLLANVKAFYPDGVKVVNDDNMTQTDVISYQFNGVPAFMPRQDNRNQWTQEHYHTQFDDVDTYSAELLEYDIACYAALAMMIDKSPALEMDFTARCDFLEAAVDETTAALAGDEAITAYKAALADLRVEAEKYLAKAQDINARYEQAVKYGASEADLDKIREEGKAYNAKALELFQFSQDSFAGLPDYGAVDVFHRGIQTNIEFLDATIEALSDGEVTEDDIWIPAEMYGWYEYYAYIFSPETCKESNETLMNVNVPDNWGTNKMSTALPSYPTTQAMCDLFYDSGKTATADYAKVIDEYKGFRAQLLDEFNSFIASETKAMKDMTEMFK